MEKLNLTRVLEIILGVLVAGLLWSAIVGSWLG